MSRIRTHACLMLAKKIAERIKLGGPITVVAAPPSTQAKYPAMAVLVDSTVYDFSMDDVVEADPTKQPGDRGYITDGFFATDPNTGAFVEGTTFLTSDGRAVSHLGTIRMKLRLWIASRDAEQREQLEDDVVQMMIEDDARPGCMLLDVAGVVVGGSAIPFGYALVEMEKSEWSAEHAFDERLWSYLPLMMDLPLLAPRNSPLASTLLLAITDDLDTPVQSVADLSELSDLRQLAVNADGNVSPAAL